MKIHLTRHGQALSFGHHKLLSNLGREQVIRLARRLREAGFQGRIHASPYCHTLVSGQVMAEALDTRVHVCPAIREIVSNPVYMANCFKGATAEEMRALCDRAVVPEDLPHPWWQCQRETRDDVQRRVAPFIDELCDGAAGGDADVCLIGHGASIGAAIRHLAERYGIDDPRLAQRRPCFNSTLTTFHVTGATASIEHLHDSDHLPEQWLTSNALTPAEVEARHRQRAAEDEATKGREIDADTALYLSDDNRAGSGER